MLCSGLWVKGPDGGKLGQYDLKLVEWWIREYGHLYKQAAKERVFMGHDVCKWLTLLVPERRAEEGVGKEAADPLSAQYEGRWGCFGKEQPVWWACGRIPWQCKSKSWEPEGDGMTLTRQWTLHLGEEDRQALILHFQTWVLWSFPGEGVPHTLFMVALCNMNSINIALITNTVWPTSSV